MNELPPIDGDDLVDWREQALIRPFGCWPFFAAMIASWAAVAAVLWSVLP